MMKLFLLVAGVFLFPVALSYGVDPAATLPKFMNITVEGTDQTHIFRALMGLYLGMVTFCIIAAFTPEWRHVAVIWAVFFAYSLAAGRILSLIVDGMPSPILLFYMAVELIVGTLGLLVLAREKAQSSKLGNDVGQELILDAGDLVLEEQLLLFQPLELKLVGAARFLERVDGAVEIAVLLLELEQRRPELANLLALHGRPSSSLCLEGTSKVSRRISGRARLLARRCTAWRTGPKWARATP